MLEEHDKGQNSSQRAIMQREICAVSAHEWFLIFVSTRLDVNFETIGVVTMRSHRRNHLLPSCFSEDGQFCSSCRP